jgi:hypothetical protein
VLARARSVFSTAEPFDPATSTRGLRSAHRTALRLCSSPTPGCAAAVLARCRHQREAIAAGGRGNRARTRWRSAWADLETRAMDVAIVPSDDVPVRFMKRLLYEEDFVLAMRAGHPLTGDPSLARYCEGRHMVVSLEGDSRGFIDAVLAREGRTRRVALTVRTSCSPRAASQERSDLRRAETVRRRARGQIRPGGDRSAVAACQVPVEYRGARSGLDGTPASHGWSDCSMEQVRSRHARRWLTSLVQHPSRTVINAGARSPSSAMTSASAASSKLPSACVSRRRPH